MERSMTLTGRITESLKRRTLQQLVEIPGSEGGLLMGYLELLDYTRELREFGELEELVPIELRQLVAQLGAEKERHTLLLERRLADLGEQEPRASWSVHELCDYRGDELAELADEEELNFAQGRLVPMMAILYQMDRITMAAFRRHAEVLASREDWESQGACHRLIDSILSDTTRSAAKLRRALNGLVTPAEAPRLIQLTLRIEGHTRALSLPVAVIGYVEARGARLAELVRRPFGWLTGFSKNREFEEIGEELL